MMTSTTRISPRRLRELARLIAGRGRKAKASLSLSEDLIKAADELAGSEGRSALVEDAVRVYLRAVVRRMRHRRDLEAINAHASATNRESDDLLHLQAWPD
jgi:metal-responsive CopG/Arc/MetJ family transcriptional regulator